MDASKVFLITAFLFLMALTYLHTTLITISVAAWATKLAKLTTTDQPAQRVALAKRCLHLYSEFDRGMGTFLFFSFSYLQISWIVFSFLSLATLLSADSVITMIGYSLMATGSLLLFTSFTFCLSMCHPSLQQLARGVRADSRGLAPGRERDEAWDLIHVSSAPRM
jgi:hypothetical protein